MIPRIYLYGTAERYKNYLRAVTAAGGELCLNGCPETCDGLLLPGGGDIAPWRYGQENRSSRDVEPERDQEELALLAMFAAIKRPVLGICRGLQTINVFFGGTLLQHIQGHSAAEGIDRFHRVYTAPSFLRELYGGPMASRADERKICRKQCGGWRCFVQLVFESVSPAGENGRSLRACEKTAKNCMKTA